ncbi:hypothetical protein BUALT_Bualt01G0222600 [Buddleja alternifolia]|uniref:C2 domain-containing protein n=1 Tax=Buddleja alternifolia TaxID=168488 RepID=A0AAV6YJN9_9LAMI|nr:hypothetical protein BUALT_Bualt01G0222600 [Buddleja alternifolia]
MEKPSSMARVIEVPVISAEGLLLNHGQSVKNNAFIILESNHPFTSRSTAMDREGGSYPSWNEKFVMELPVGAHFISAEAHSGDMFIGKVMIPVSDFIDLPENYLSFLSYRLKDVKGKKNGIFNLSVKVMGGGGKGCAAVCAPSTAVAPADGKVVDGKVVDGIPVPYQNY